jgi:transposase
MSSHNRDTYSLQLRTRAIKSLENGDSCRQVAERFEIGLRSTQRLWKRYRETGEVMPRRRGGGKKAILSGHDSVLQGWIKRQPDITLLELREALGKDGIVVGKSALANRLDRLGLSYKKNPARRRAGQG